LKLACGNAAVEILAALVVLLPPTDHQLALLDADIELIAGESGNSKRNSQPLWILPITRQPLDVVGRIAVSPFGNAVEHALDLVESQKKRAGEGRNSRHWSQSPRLKRL
jgi:hypothetical protein